MRSRGPNGHGPAVGVRDKVGPDQIIERTRQEMIKNKVGHLRYLGGSGSLKVYRGICGGDAHERVNRRSVGGPTKNVGRRAGSAGIRQ